MPRVTLPVIVNADGFEFEVREYSDAHFRSLLEICRSDFRSETAFRRLVDAAVVRSTLHDASGATSQRTPPKGRRQRENTRKTPQEERRQEDPSSATSTLLEGRRSEDTSSAPSRETPFGLVLLFPSPATRSTRLLHMGEGSLTT